MESSGFEKPKNDGTVKFCVKTYEDGKKPLLQLGPGDHIYVRGKLTTHDLEVVEAMRLFLRDSMQRIKAAKAIVAAAEKSGITA